jgi:putative transposase
MNSSKSLYFRHRFPSEIISHFVWLYFRFSLSYRDIEEMMGQRGVIVSYETIRDWSKKFDGIYAKRLRSRERKFNDHWHLNEVRLSINGKAQYLFAA